MCELHYAEAKHKFCCQAIETAGNEMTGSDRFFVDSQRCISLTQDIGSSSPRIYSKLFVAGGGPALIEETLRLTMSTDMQTVSL